MLRLLRSQGRIHFRGSDIHRLSSKELRHDLLHDLQARHRLAYLFISHDLRVVRALSSEIIVMRAGRVVEQGPTAQVFEQPQAAYTKALMAAAFGCEVVDDDAVNAL